MDRDTLIFSGNDIVCYICLDGYEPRKWYSPTQIAADGRWVGKVERHALEPGEYIVAQFTQGSVGGGYSGLNFFSAQILELKESIELAYPPDAVLQLLGAGIRLSRVQAEKFIAFIKGNRQSWVWDNAPAEIKALVSGEEPNAHDQASDLVRQAMAKGWDVDDPSTHAAPMALLRQAIALYPGVADARCILGKIAISQGNVNEAITLFAGELTMASKPDALNANSYLAIIYRELGREADAQRHAAAAMTTKEHRELPTQLIPEVVERIRAAVRHSQDGNRKSQDATDLSTVRAEAVKRKLYPSRIVIAIFVIVILIYTVVRLTR